MFEHLAEWDKLKNTDVGKALLSLVNEERKRQVAGYNFLDYELLSLGADRLENYGNPRILLENPLLFDVIPALVEILKLERFNDLAKYYALNLLWDMYNFADGEDERIYSPEKTQIIRYAIASQMPIYQKLLDSPNQDVQRYTQRFIELIQRN